MKPKTRIIIGVLAVMLIILGTAGSFIYSIRKVNDGYKQIKLGDLEQKVVELMGKPDKVVSKTDKHFWSANIEGSIREYHYEVALWSEIWVVAFDSNNQVVYRTHNIM
jgi:hypothetical protein